MEEEKEEDDNEEKEEDDEETVKRPGFSNNLKWFPLFSGSHLPSMASQRLQRVAEDEETIGNSFSKRARHCLGDRMVELFQGRNIFQSLRNWTFGSLLEFKSGIGSW